MKRIGLLFTLFAVLPALGHAQRGDIYTHGPIFPSGDFQQWVLKKLEYPKEALDDGITGVVKIKYRVVQNGIMLFEITECPHPALLTYLQAALHSSPDWLPAMKSGIPIMPEPTYEMSIDLSRKFTADQLRGMRVASLYSPAVPVGERSQENENILMIKRLIREEVKPKSDIWHKGGYRDTVEIKFVIGKDGALKQYAVEGVRNGDVEKLIAAAIEKNLKEWTPATFDGQPEESSRTVTMLLNYSYKGKTNEIDDTYFTDEIMPPAFNKGPRGLDDMGRFRLWVNTAKVYPQEMDRRAIEGDVLAKFRVNEEGKVKDVKVIAATNSNFFISARAAMENATGWTAAFRHGQPISVTYTLHVEFRQEATYFDKVGPRK